MNIKNLIPLRLRRNIAIIPVVRLAGVISASSSPVSRNLNLANVAPLLEKAFSLKRAPAVALVVNSPGGSPVQSRLIYTRIRDLAKKHEKKVMIFVEDVAASGGYMICLAGDEIFADPTSIIGSIGVVSAASVLIRRLTKSALNGAFIRPAKTKCRSTRSKPKTKKTSNI